MIDKDNDKLIDILTNEINNRRSEINLYVKDINYCLFSFIASMGLFASLYLNILIKNEIIKDENITLLAFSISQIEFIIITLAMSLLSGIAAGAAHISHMEKRINLLTKNHVLFWESELSHHEWTRSPLIFIHMLIWFFCLFVFGYLLYMSNSPKINFFYLAIQILEIIVSIGIMVYLKDERFRVMKYLAKMEDDYISKQKV